MDDNIIANLKEALQFSPDNFPLKIQLAEMLLKAGRLDEAEHEYKGALALNGSDKAKTGLANVYYSKGEYSRCNVIMEELLQAGKEDFNLLLLHAKALLKEGSKREAVNAYQRALSLNPGYSDDELDGQLRLGAAENEDAIDEDDFNPFVQKSAVNFNHVGGMENVKKEIEMKIINPLKHADLYKAYGKKTGGGILLYGPPGCGKTYIAKATAGQVNARFISVGLNDILDMWIGNSEKNLHDIFEIARQNKPCVLFFDEIDAIAASRTDMKKSAGRQLINQFLQELDGMNSDNDGVLIIGATNTPWHLDQAFRRPGRFDRIIFVPPPDEEAREAIFELKLRNKPVENINYRSLAEKTKDFSGADIDAVIDIAIENKLQESFKSGTPQPLSTSDIVNASRKHKASTSEWFATAKNFALYANEAGLYDEILHFLKIKK